MFEVVVAGFEVNFSVQRTCIREVGKTEREVIQRGRDTRPIGSWEAS